MMQGAPQSSAISGSALARMVRVSRGLVLRKPLGFVSAMVLVIIVVGAVFAPAIAPRDPLKIHYGSYKMPPSRTFWLGTDYQGRDILSRVIWGSRMSLFVGIISVALGASVGALWGLVSSYSGGLTDLISQRFLDMIMAFPSLILALALMVALGANITNVIIAIAITRVPYAVRVVRSVGLGAKRATYVEAARAIGASPLRIMLFHVAPACVPSFIIVATGSTGVAIVMEASLSFLGVGVPPLTPTWGGLLAGVSADVFSPLPWLVLPPGIAIFITVLAFNLLGDVCRDILDPKLRGT